MSLLSSSRLVLGHQGRRQSGVRLQLLTQVVDRFGVSGKTGIIDATEVRVQRPAATRKDRGEFISGTSRHNAVKAWWSRTRPLRVATQIDRA